MNKKDYLDALAKALDCLSREKRSEILSFYQEAIDDRIEEGMSEEEAVCAMGPVELAAESILGELPVVPASGGENKAQKSRAALGSCHRGISLVDSARVRVPARGGVGVSVHLACGCVHLACGGGLHVRATVRFVSGMVRRDDGNIRLRSRSGRLGVRARRRRPARVQRGVFGEPRFGSAFSEMDTKGRLSVQTLRGR